MYDEDMGVDSDHDNDDCITIHSLGVIFNIVWIIIAMGNRPPIACFLCLNSLLDLVQ